MKTLTEFTIKRKNVQDKYNCPICKNGELQWRGSANLFRFECMNRKCGKMFM